MRLAIVVLGIVFAAVAAAAPPAPQSAGTRGERTYRSFCWTCHGRYGRGDGPAASYLAAPPPDLTDPTVLKGKSDAQILAYFKGGKAGAATAHIPMATIANLLKEDALRDAIAYMRTLALPGKHVSLLAGEDVYKTFCVGCHGPRGQGQGPAAANLAGAKPRDFTAKDFVIEGREKEVYQAIFMGAAKAFHGSPYMPEWRTTLSSQQIQDVIEYVKSLKRKARR